jgi:hypothetical protein
MKGARAMTTEQKIIKTKVGGVDGQGNAAVYNYDAVGNLLPLCFHLHFEL